MKRNSRHNQARRARRARRGAVLTMELLLVTPLFLLLLFAIVEFSLLTAAQHRVSDAAHAAVRRLCLGSADSEHLQKDLAADLGPKLAPKAVIQVNDSGRTGDRVYVRVELPMRNASPDLLWMTGFSVQNRILAGEALMVREHDALPVREASAAIHGNGEY
ncbi:MAG: pilus assembly protein [Planctomycetaceae bacterium]|nr:pilus assembly protein [Planctomycetaceae bacterium]